MCLASENLIKFHILVFQIYSTARIYTYILVRSNTSAAIGEIGNYNFYVFQHEFSVAFPLPRILLYSSQRFFKLWSTEESLWLGRRMRAPISPNKRRQDGLSEPPAARVASAGPGQGGGIVGQHIHPTDSEIIITICAQWCCAQSRCAQYCCAQ